MERVPCIIVKHKDNIGVVLQTNASLEARQLGESLIHLVGNVLIFLFLINKIIWNKVAITEPTRQRLPTSEWNSFTWL